MSRYSDFKKKSLEDPEIRSAYDELQPEYDIIQVLIDARKNQNFTQKELSLATGITQADINELKTGREIQVSIW
jgi:predicted XRE-type DNA-binding protein